MRVPHFRASGFNGCPEDIVVRTQELVGTSAKAACDGIRLSTSHPRPLGGGSDVRVGGSQCWLDVLFSTRTPQASELKVEPHHARASVFI